MFKIEKETQNSYRSVSILLLFTVIFLYIFYGTSAFNEKSDNEKIQSVSCKIFDSYSWSETKQIFINLLYNSNWKEQDTKSIKQLEDTLATIKDWAKYSKCWTLWNWRYEIYSDNGIRILLKEELSQSLVKYLVSPWEAEYRLNEMLEKHRIRLAENMTDREVWIYKDLEYKFDKVDWRVEIIKKSETIE